MAGGRPVGSGDYDPQFHDEQVYNLALLGKTAKEMALLFGVSHSTFKRWLKEHPSFWASVSRGREMADAQVAASLFKRATGFDVDETKYFVVKTSRETEEIKGQAVKTYFPPDASAALNWLKNRQPDLWRDKVDIGLPPEITLRMNLDGEPHKPDEEA